MTPVGKQYNKDRIPDDASTRAIRIDSLFIRKNKRNLINPRMTDSIILLPEIKENSSMKGKTVAQHFMMKM